MRAVRWPFGVRVGGQGDVLAPHLVVDSADGDQVPARRELNGVTRLVAFADDRTVALGAEGVRVRRQLRVVLVDDEVEVPQRGAGAEVPGVDRDGAAGGRAAGGRGCRLAAQASERRHQRQESQSQTRDRSLCDRDDAAWCPTDGSPSVDPAWLRSTCLHGDPLSLQRRLVTEMPTWPTNASSRCTRRFLTALSSRCHAAVINAGGPVLSNVRPRGLFVDDGLVMYDDTGPARA